MMQIDATYLKQLFDLVMLVCLAYSLYCFFICGGLLAWALVSVGRPTAPVWVRILAGFWGGLFAGLLWVQLIHWAGWDTLIAG